MAGVILEASHLNNDRIGQVTNLTEDRCRIIRLLGPPAYRYYLMS
ncbi:hypothetical protein [Lyngbya confervoides]|nr:hypothetical protein [Lyngbya confervoides]